MRNEYTKVFNFYQVEMTERMNLEDELKEKAADIAQLQADLKRLVEEKIVREEIAHQQNKFKVENKKLHENYENKCLEIKHLKNDFENIKKEKNELSVALKRSRQEHKEYIKAVTKDNELLQKKIVDLHEFKTKKVNDERNERIRKKKEFK